jgi:hypothetical protein
MIHVSLELIHIAASWDDLNFVSHLNLAPAQLGFVPRGGGGDAWPRLEAEVEVACGRAALEGASHRNQQLQVGDELEESLEQRN